MGNGLVTAVLSVALARGIIINLLLWHKQEWICFQLYFPLSYAAGCCFAHKKKKKNGWRRVGSMLSLGEPSGTVQPISVHKRMSCSLGVCFGSCQPLPSIFIFLFICPFIIHTPFQTFQTLSHSLSLFFFFFLTQDSLSAAHLLRTDGSRNVKSASIWLRGRTWGFWRRSFVLLRFFQPLPGTIWVLN